MSLKSAQTAKIGRKFKSTRELLGLSEIQVSQKIYINTDYIKAIESGDYSIFPARMFALRYFEKYSIFLGINQVFFDIYDVKHAPENSEEIKKDWIKDFHPQITIAVPLFLLIIFFILITNRDSLELSSEIINLPSEVIEKTQALTSVNNYNLTDSTSSPINPMIQQAIDNSEESKVGAFEVSQGVINNLSLRFIEESWVEIYQGNQQLIYKLFKTNESLNISITPPFKIIVGNARGIVGFYNQNEINFTQVANELNVSSIEIDNE
ncbi:helix-turn-helix domain-containing protein [Gammaproteobacteria bacterium]|nr:helix-turn-helix domain-containing protein [Gammaproteobacteria bacterium]